MAIANLFSKRQKKERNEHHDVYQYENIPLMLRVQFVQILYEALGLYDSSSMGHYLFKNIEETLCREYGILHLTEPRIHGFQAIKAFILESNEAEMVLDVVEMASQYIVSDVTRNPSNFNSPVSPSDAINEINHRFLEHGVGYQFEAGQIIQVDSKLVHKEVIIPTLHFIAEPQFKGANDEFLSAHKHYREKNYKECLTDCLKAFESTMKVICDKRKWDYDASRSTAKALVAIMFNNKLIPDSMQSHFTAFSSTLDSGLPTLRNRLAAHGQGSEVIDVPDYIASYALHLTATNILFLVNAERALD